MSAEEIFWRGHNESISTGEGLLANIQSASTTWTTPSVIDIQEWINEASVNWQSSPNYADMVEMLRNPHPERSYNLYTGIEGSRMFDDAMMNYPFTPSEVYSEPKKKSKNRPKKSYIDDEYNEIILELQNNEFIANEIHS